MCRQYPNGKACEFRNCSWDKWKPVPNSEKLIHEDSLVRRKTTIFKTCELPPLEGITEIGKENFPESIHLQESITMEEWLNSRCDCEEE